jgi:hypothetical protein
MAIVKDKPTNKYGTAPERCHPRICRDYDDTILKRLDDRARVSMLLIERLKLNWNVLLPVFRRDGEALSYVCRILWLVSNFLSLIFCLIDIKVVNLSDAWKES